MPGCIPDWEGLPHPAHQTQKHMLRKTPTQNTHSKSTQAKQTSQNPNLFSCILQLRKEQPFQPSGTEKTCKNHQASSGLQHQELVTLMLGYKATTAAPGSYNMGKNLLPKIWAIFGVSLSHTHIHCRPIPFHHYLKISINMVKMSTKDSISTECRIH